MKWWIDMDAKSMWINATMIILRQIHTSFIFADKLADPVVWKHKKFPRWKDIFTWNFTSYFVCFYFSTCFLASSIELNLPKKYFSSPKTGCAKNEFHLSLQKISFFFLFLFSLNPNHRCQNTPRTTNFDTEVKHSQTSTSVNNESVFVPNVNLFRKIKEQERNLWKTVQGNLKIP